jgi:transcription antitermination factor NusG
MKKTLGVWNNRQKNWIIQVFFPNYISVNTCPSELYKMSQIPKVVACVNLSGTHSILSSNEVNAINEILTVETNSNKGERVKIVRGPLVGRSEF